jgi:hypothetical protein
MQRDESTIGNTEDTNEKKIKNRAPFFNSVEAHTAQEGIL